MTKPPRFLLISARALAILAILVGVGAGALDMAFSPFICIDHCPDTTSYFSQLSDSATSGLIPCAVLGTLGLFALVAYYRLTGRARRSAMVSLLVTLTGVVGAVGLTLLLNYMQTSIRVGADGYSAAPTLSTAMLWWGVAVALVAGGWSAILGWLTWSVR